MSSYLLGFISTQGRVLYSNRLQQTEAVTPSLSASSGKCGLASEISFNKRHSSLLCFVLFSPLINMNSLPVTRVKEKMWAEGTAVHGAFHHREIKARQLNLEGAGSACSDSWGSTEGSTASKVKSWLRSSKFFHQLTQVLLSTCFPQIIKIKPGSV